MAQVGILACFVETLQAFQWKIVGDILVRRLHNEIGYGKIKRSLLRFIFGGDFRK
jgi:hypothetical protein